MTSLTLLTKVYNKGQLKQIEMSLQATFEDLDAQIQVLDKPVNRWVKVQVTGEDENVAKSYITKQIGICPNSIEEITVNTEWKGYLQKINTPEGLTVDIGILEQKPIYAHIPLNTIQTQLLNGADIPLKKITELFALGIDLPVSIKIKNIQATAAENVIEAEFSPIQLELFKNWQNSLLDRLLILGITTDEATATIERTRLNRDVISIEPLGLFEQVLTCKLGTDATGLIPRIGRYMRNTQLLIFNPKKHNY
ncbi:MAG: DUF2110 family protein [Candidatus Bathyarchaeota archaeon]|uniref:DUF2110 family protein n=1 Tax=Candidatus Bathycorpusculum sp. TaxID=2994959 RepID=UPI0028250A09|nr:DUF2110 family protein [Candidatus Termiticorpusculum sp.]MCL2257594.1 DUF2110 family protein [Candidatus Termiticorpusculum sp.]MCL2292257.1 DUF2110 family protein [Candidatus Termiticorpusculum sp.]